MNMGVRRDSAIQSCRRVWRQFRNTQQVCQQAVDFARQIVNYCPNSICTAETETTNRANTRKRCFSSSRNEIVVRYRDRLVAEGQATRGEPILTAFEVPLYSADSFLRHCLSRLIPRVPLMPARFVDIHCHLLPAVDDGSPDWETTLRMAEMAAADGTETIIVTPHQLGNFAHNQGDAIRARTVQLQQVLDQHGIALEVLAGGDVRIEDGMIELLRTGQVMSLGDRRRHVLLELPHELYFPLEPVLAALERIGMTGILSHPERNRGLQRTPELLPSLVEQGCLMQVTAGSLVGSFSEAAQHLAEWMLDEGLVHFIATDAHGIRSRRPLMQRAYQRVAELCDQQTADELCAVYPGFVARGEQVPGGIRRPSRATGWRGFFSAKKVG